MTLQEARERFLSLVEYVPAAVEGGGSSPELIGYAALTC